MSVRGPLLPGLAALVLGAGTATLMACGGDDSGSGKFGPTTADRLQSRLQAAQDAYADGDCARAAEAVQEARSVNIPESVDDRLAERLQEGLDALERELPGDCEAQTQEEEVPTVTEEVPTTTQETEPPPETTAPEETTPTVTEPPATQPTEPTETIPQDPDIGGGSGGISPDQGPQD